MRKLTLNLVLVFFVLLFSSCSLNRTTETTETTETKQTLGEWMINRINKEDEGKIATHRLEQIIEAINIRDKDIIKEMFSEQALSEAEDLDGGVNYLFTLIDEKIL